jgi:glycosyltransferase involved in cell wall biosynthesis
LCLRKYDRSAIWEDLDCRVKILNVHSIGSARGILGFAAFVLFLIKNRVDVIQTFFFDSVLYGILAAKLAGIENTISWRRDMGFWYDRKLLKWINFVNRFTKRILVNSRSIKESVIENEKFPAERIDIIYNGIDVSEIAAQKAVPLTGKIDGLGKEDRIVGIVGNFNRKVKRFDLFIQAAAVVAAQCERVKFLIVGGGKLERDLRELAHRLGVADHLNFVGKKDNVIPYVKNFSVGVLTSDSEGLPNALLEYMACGVASVATDVGGNRELIQSGKTGVLVPGGDPQALARAIIALLDDRPYRERLGYNARAHVNRHFAWEQKIREIESYYLGLEQN